MGDVIKFRAARKKQDRKKKEAVAEQNRITHGLTKVEKEAAKADRQQAERDVDSHKIEPSDPEKP